VIDVRTDCKTTYGDFRVWRSYRDRPDSQDSGVGAGPAVYSPPMVPVNARSRAGSIRFPVRMAQSCASCLCAVDAPPSGQSARPVSRCRTGPAAPPARHVGTAASGVAKSWKCETYVGCDRTVAPVLTGCDPPRPGHWGPNATGIEPTPRPRGRVGMLYRRLRRAMSWGCQNGQDSPRALSKFPGLPRRYGSDGHGNGGGMSTTANPQRARWCAWRSDSVLFPDKTGSPLGRATTCYWGGSPCDCFRRRASLVALALASVWIF